MTKSHHAHGTKISEQLTPTELEVMEALWEEAPSNAQSIRKRLKRDLAYTTVQTILDTLHKKRHVARELKDRSYTYRPRTDRARALRGMLDEVIQRLFGGSAETLVMNLLDSKSLSPEQIARLKQTVLEHKEKAP